MFTSTDSSSKHRHTAVAATSRIRQPLPLRVPKFRQPYQTQFHVHLPDDNRGLASVSHAHPSLPTSLAGYEVLHIFYQTTQWPSGLLILNLSHVLFVHSLIVGSSTTFFCFTLCFCFYFLTLPLSVFCIVLSKLFRLRSIHSVVTPLEVGPV